MKLRTKILAFALSLVGASAAFADTVVLNFEGINSTYPANSVAFIQNYYDGGTSSVGTSGTNYGITFSANAQALCLNTPGVLCSNTSRGGLGDPGSQQGAMTIGFGSKVFMDDPGGFTSGISLFYTAMEGGSLGVYSGLDGAGTLLATLSLPTTASGCTSVYNAGFCPFIPIGIDFSGTAESVSFTGANSEIVFDDLTLGSSTPEAPTPEPSTIAMMLTGAAAGVGALRRRLAKV
jgi:hypothetical protein